LVKLFPVWRALLKHIVLGYPYRRLSIPGQVRTKPSKRMNEEKEMCPQGEREIGNS